ncbi:hypothetical protein GCM10009682_24550 [Luedemannella flava]|uniref:Uncharacterized protein n=1 Tax=Luedemannella flava TaxID=349316 RepID=A0ABN2LXM8_9ACTN
MYGELPVVTTGPEVGTEDVGTEDVGTAEVGGRVVGGRLVGGRVVTTEEVGGRVVGAALVGVVLLHAVPLTVNDVGLAPEPVPLKPMLADAFVARLPFQLMLVAVTFWPDWVQFADQPLVTRWVEEGKVNASVQLLNGSPMLVMVMFAPNPPPPSHAFVYVTRHPGAA